ncbi:MAG: PilN domain-containing protein, partial [Lachnospiraceae bacterium]|nr:PilN domain-containing protein [Lachnospiraceae bacterium]
TVVNIMNGSTMVMQRSVPYGRLAIADAVKISRGISDDEADMVLIDEDLNDLSAQYPDVADAVRSMLSSIGRILEFYRARNADHPIERIYMIGDVTSVNGLAELMDSEMEQDVEVISSLRGVEVKNKHVLSDEIVANYLANIGAVLEPMRISLSDQSKKGEKVKTGGEKLPWWILIFAAVMAAVMCGALIFIYHTKKQENDDIRTKIDSLGDVETIKTQYEQSQSDLNMMRSWYDSTKGANESLARLFADLEEKQPAAVAITKFSSTGGEVSIDGLSYGKPAVAEFVKQLKKLPYVSNVKVDFINEGIEDYSAKDSFNLKFTLQYDDPYKSEDESDDNVETMEEDDIVSVEEVAEPEDETVNEDNSDNPGEDSETDESETEEPEDESSLEGGVE